MFIQAALFAAQMWLGEITRPRPKRIGFGEFVENNKPDELRPIAYGAGTFEITPQRIWYGDYKQRAVERDSHWSDYLWAGALSALLDFITVAYRYYIGEAFILCYDETHVERVTIGDRLMYQAVIGTDNAGGGFLIDDPQAWGGDQPPGEGGEYAWVDITRGNYTDPTNAYIESLLSDAPNRAPSLRGISALFKRGPSGFTESGFFAAGGLGFIPHFKEWKVTCRRQPNHLLTGFHQVKGPGKTARRHANPAEVIYEWATSIEYGAKLPLEELNVTSLQAAAETFYNEDNGWSGKIETPTQPMEVINNVCAQVDAVFDPSPSLGFTLRLIRRTYSIGSLRVLNLDNVSAVDNFSPGTYDDTVNKVEVPCFDQDNNFTERKGVYVDAANLLIQDGREVPQTQDYLGVGDLPTANAHATRDGQALSVPRAAMACDVLPSFGRESYRGEPVLLEWESPTFTKVMRTLEVTPSGPERQMCRLRLIEDPFATGFRTSADPGGTDHDDPGTGLDTAPPSAAWNEAEFPPDGLLFTLQTANTNQFLATITGGIVFGSYTPGGQYARLYVTEPGGVETLSPVRLLPDTNNEATFQWPALAAGTYEFCVETYSLRGATNGVKVCAEIVVAEIGSPSASPSASVSPSVSPSLSPSSSVSASPSPSISISPSLSPSASVSPSVSSSASASVSPSSSTSHSPSPSSSASPSAPPPSAAEIVVTSNAEIERNGQDLVTHNGAFASGVTGADGRVFNNVTFITSYSYLSEEFVSTGMRFYVRVDGSAAILAFNRDSSIAHVRIDRTTSDVWQVLRGDSTVLATGTTTIAIDTWYYLTLYTRIHDTLGEFTAKLFDASGALLETLSATGIDTRNAGTDLALQTVWGNATIDTYVDHLWMDLAGDFRGCGYVETLAATANGDTNSWTRGGTNTGNNWDQVNEVPKDETSYVFSTGADEVELYNFQNRTVAGTPITVHQIVYDLAHTAGTREWKPIAKIDGVIYEGTTESTTSTDPNSVPTLVRRDNNPATGNAWEDSVIDAAQYGMKSVTTDVRVQAVALQVLVDIES